LEHIITTLAYVFSARDGKNLSVMDIVRGRYSLSTLCAMFLSFVGFLALGKFGRIELYEIGKHGVIEHDGSLVHHDTPKNHIYAPIEIDHSLVDAMVSDVKPSLINLISSLPFVTLIFRLLLFGCATRRLKMAFTCLGAGKLALELGCRKRNSEDDMFKCRWCL